MCGVFFTEERKCFQKKKESARPGNVGVIGGGMMGAFGVFAVAPIILDNVDFLKRRIERGDETFSKIANHEDYQPSKQTALAFAIALKLDFEKTQKLLATAGYTLGNSMLSDMIVSFFIEYKIFDVDLINEFFYKYKIPLPGG